MANLIFLGQQTWFSLCSDRLHILDLLVPICNHPIPTTWIIIKKKKETCSERLFKMIITSCLASIHKIILYSHSYLPKTKLIKQNVFTSEREEAITDNQPLE